MTTDDNIIISCAECWPNHTEQGIQAMNNHILAKHPHYSKQEAEVYALSWMQDAYAQEDQENADHAYLHKIHQCDCQVDKEAV